MAPPPRPQPEAKSSRPSWMVPRCAPASATSVPPARRPLPEGYLDQRRVHLVGQIALRKLREGAGKGGFRRHLRASFPTENATQRLVDIEALDQSGGGRNAQHRLGDESPGEGAAIVRRAAGASGRF